MIRRVISSLFSILVFYCALFVTSSSAEPKVHKNEKIVRLSSLEWPPYTGPELAGGGKNIALISRAFAAKGYQLEVGFYPWRRAVLLAKESKAYDGVVPEYFTEAGAEDFLFSDPFDETELVLVFREADPIDWNRIEDLAEYSVGVVNGYVNTSEFDDLIDRGVLKVSGAIDDATNLLKLIRGRVQVVVIDKAVFQYLIQTDTRLKAAVKNLVVHPKELSLSKLYICFKNNERGALLRNVFNEGLKLLGDEVQL